MKYRQIIVANLHNAWMELRLYGCYYGWQWPTNLVVAAEREDAGRFTVHAHDMSIAFSELHAAIHRQLELE